MAAQAREWAPVALEAAREHEPAALFEEMVDLPARHYRLQLRVPGLLAPELERLRLMIVADDEEGWLRHAEHLAVPRPGQPDVAGHN